MIPDSVHRATYRHPPELVWKAIATGEGLEAWLMCNDFREASVGHRFQFRDRPRRPFWDGICNCEVVEADAPKRLAMRWGIDGKGESTRLTIDLTPTPDGGTSIELRHAGMKGVLGWIMKKGMDKGWARMVARSIPTVCEGMAKGKVPTRDEVKAVMRGEC